MTGRRSSVRAGRRVIVLVLIVPLGACDWVDSTGRQEAAAVVQSDAIVLQDTAPGGAELVLEDRRVPVVVARAGSVDAAFDYRFETEVIASGALETCLGVDGFDPARAAGSLEDACASDADCRIVVERDEQTAAVSGERRFDLVVPRLRAPVGLRFQLVTGHRVEEESGESAFVEDARRDVDLCLVSINEAPDARDDSYALIAGGTLQVDAANGLIFNDLDDDDVGNDPLRVLNEEVQPPAGAARFEVYSDGGFFYDSGDTERTEDLYDSFSYTITDGQGFSSATATVRVISANEAPTLIANLPNVTGRVGELLEFDFDDYFLDPEGARLNYAFQTPLPDDGNLELSEAGLLAGFPDTDDVGQYLLTLNVDDGGFGAQVSVSLIIEAAEVDEAPVYVEDTVFDQNVDLGDRMVSVKPQFQDPEGEPLVYRSVGTDLPSGVVLDPDTGIVSGRPRSLGTTFGLIVEASDPGGQSARSDEFFVRVR